MRSLMRDVYKNAYETRNLYDYERMARLVLDHSIVKPGTVLKHSRRLKNEVEDHLSWDYKYLCEDIQKRCENGE